MKKYLYLFMIAVLGLGCLTACGSAKEEGKTQTAKKQNENVKETPDTKAKETPDSSEDLLSGTVS